MLPSSGIAVMYLLSCLYRKKASLFIIYLYTVKHVSNKFDMIVRDFRGEVFCLLLENHSSEHIDFFFCI